MPSQSVNFESKIRNPQISSVFDIAPEELNKKINDVKIIDVRRPEEWTGEFGHIAEAELLALHTLPDLIETLPRDRTIVFVCRSGARSAQAAAFAIENGIVDVYNMRGGMIEWVQLNFKSVNRSEG